MKTLVLTAAAIVALTAAPAMAMSCCGEKGMCGKAATTMVQGSMKKSKGCCCEKMSMSMSKRR